MAVKDGITPAGIPPQGFQKKKGIPQGFQSVVHHKLQNINHKEFFHIAVGSLTFDFLKYLSS